jgi:hypothetical protein
MRSLEYAVTEFHVSDGKCRGTIADLMLDADLIPRCGLIPPFEVVARIFRLGGGDRGMSRGCIWGPFELTEEEYWQAVDHLQRLNSEDLSSRHRDPHIVGKIQPDYASPQVDDYLAWLRSLVQRGHLPGPHDSPRKKA